ncbi:MAG: hypothetical protein ACMXYC_00385 [Candidatus Woesearchaeota archaeon]
MTVDRKIIPEVKGVKSLDQLPELMRVYVENNRDNNVEYSTDPELYKTQTKWLDITVDPRTYPDLMKYVWSKIGVSGKQVDIFMDNSELFIRVYESGVVFQYHYMQPHALRKTA